DNLFAMNLYYNNPISGLEKDAQYNGNISGTSWQNAEESKLIRKYEYSYDYLNRLTIANYSGGSVAGGYNTDYNYDINGNITKLNRTMIIRSKAEIDKLEYNYNIGDNRTNQLQSVVDKSVDFKDNGFKQGTSNTYAYDLNGNMIVDNNKGLTNIKYNYLNLPYSLTKTDNNGVRSVKYIYDASGRKLANLLPGKIKYYFGNFVYEDNNLQYMICSEGLMNIDGTTATYEFHLKDHLGNTRIAVNQTGEVTQKNNYYPFGMRFRIKNSDNKYLYNGKELQEETDWLDYGARFYMADIGRWGAIDPLAESYSSQSTYHFSGNNPMRFIDFNGMNYDDYFSYTGNFLGSDNASTDYIRIMDQGVWNNNKTVNENGTESIEHLTGVEKSELFSKARCKMSPDNQLTVYEHYNPTNLLLVQEERKDKSGGMAFSSEKPSDNSPINTEKIKIRLYGNAENGYSDHSNIITNMLSHEKEHYNDFSRLGLKAYYNQTPNQRESNAVIAQTMDSSYSYLLMNMQQNPIISTYINSVRLYGIKYGMKNVR
ncbi:MAG: hypothetical protein JXA53_08480, partial [Bacteroidales bacterium]|nr:hypothetical protein [Bacteroidales bacterium]